MKILVICQYYAPEPFRISDVCQELVARGHEVTVVTGVPNYPEGVVYSGYEKGQKRDEIINGVHIHRCSTIPRKQGTLCRFLNYYSYVFSSCAYVRKCKAKDASAFDVVFVNQLSPVMMAYAAIAYKSKHKIPMVLYCLDLWPESLIAGGISRTSLVYKLFHRISGRIYRAADQILVTSRLFEDYLNREFHIESQRIKYLPQYAEGIFEVLPDKKNHEFCDLLFAGNIGTAQSVETILNAAALLKEDCPNVRWHIVGGGSDLERLRKIATDKHLDNVVFYGRRPLEEMPEFYQKADAMLVTLGADPILSLTLPGKIQSYMAAGKPIIGAADGETERIIRDAQCGFCGPADHSEELAKNVRRFLASEDISAFGRNARSYYEKHFTQGHFMEFLESKLEESSQISKVTLL